MKTGVYLRRDKIQKMEVGQQGVVRTEEIRVHALPKASAFVLVVSTSSSRLHLPMDRTTI